MKFSVRYYFIQLVKAVWFPVKQVVNDVFVFEVPKIDSQVIGRYKMLAIWGDAQRIYMELVGVLEVNPLAALPTLIQNLGPGYH